MTDPIIPPYPADARETCSTVAPSDAAAEVVAESLPFVVEAPEPNAPLPGIAPAMRRVDGGYVREDAHPGVGEPDWKAQAERARAQLDALESWRCIGPDMPDAECRICTDDLDEMCLACAAQVLHERWDRTKRLLPCGHPASLALRSVESPTVLCELCEAKNAARDAEKMEAELNARLADAAKERIPTLRLKAFEVIDRLKARADAAEAKLAEAERRTSELDLLRQRNEGTIAALRFEYRGHLEGHSKQLARADAAEKRAEEAEKERDSLRAEVGRLNAEMELAWGVIANAGGGNWRNESPEWRDAAEKWRDRWHATLKITAPASTGTGGEEAKAPCGGTRCYQSADGQWFHSTKSYASCSWWRGGVTL